MAGIAACCAFACSPKKPSPPPKAPAANEAAGQRPIQPVEVERPVAWTDVDVRIESLGALLDTWAPFSVWFEHAPASPPDGRAEFESLLLSLGAGPSLGAALDYDGVHETVFSYPHPDDRDVAPAPYRFAARIAVTDARGFLQGLPSSLAPRDLGGGLFEVVSGDDRFVLREQHDAVEIASAERELDRAKALPTNPEPRFRIHASLSNLPPADLDPAPLLGLREGDPRAEKLARVLRETTQVAGAADLGPDRDLRLWFGAKAPFEDLGLDPLGPAMKDPSPLEAAFPYEPAVAVEVSVAEAAKALEPMMAALPIDELPEPFGSLARKGLERLRALASLASGRALMALFFDEKHEATVLLAVGVSDEAKARAEARGLLELFDELARAQNDLVGGDAKARIKARLAHDGVRVGKTKADLLSVTAPKDADVEHLPLAPFFRKGRAEVAAWTQDRYLLVAIGAGSRALGGRLGRALAGKKGGAPASALALARADGGCQVCVGLELETLLRLSLYAEAGNTRDGARRKTLEKMARSLAARDERLAVGIGAVVEDDRGALRVRVPKASLFPPRSYVEALREAFDRILDEHPPPAADGSARAP